MSYAPPTWDVWSVEVSSHQGRGVAYTPLLRCLLPAVDMPRAAENSKSGLGATVVVLCCCALYLSEDSVSGTTETPTALVIHLMTSAEVLQFTIKINSNSSLTCSSAIKIAVRTTIFYRWHKVCHNPSSQALQEKSTQVWFLIQKRT